MTETGLNAQIRQTEALRIELLPPSPRRPTGAAYRREMQARKNDALVRAVSRRYIPGVPYVDRGFGGPPLLHSGYYIKYPRSSKKKKRLKRLTGKRCRRERSLPLKGNQYRRVLNRWLILD